MTMLMSDPGRLHRQRSVSDAVADAARRAWVHHALCLGGRVSRHGGLLVALAGRSDPSQDVALVEVRPEDPVAALRSASRAQRRGRPALRLDLEHGRHPEIEAILARCGTTAAMTREALVADPCSVSEPRLGAAVVIHRAHDEADLVQVRGLYREAFGRSRSGGGATMPLTALSAPGLRVFVATVGGQVVAAAGSHLDRGVVALFGVATRRSHQGRGLATALVARAVADAGLRGATLAATTPVGGPVSLCRSAGFEPVGRWTVWVRS